MGVVAPVTSELVLREAINTGKGLDPVQIMEEHIRLQHLLLDADEALMRAGVKRGNGNIRARISETVR